MSSQPGNQRRVLISGASIAGNTLAFWLARAGCDVTVVERAPAFRDGGQNVDVRGTARHVLGLMGLEEAAIAQGTGERGVRFVDAAGATVAEFLLEDLDGQGFTAELEVLRGDLARILYEASRGHASYRFGDTILAIEEGSSEALVRFEHALPQAFDLVVIAEGVGSRTRERIFPGENRPRYLDVTMGYFTMPKGASDGDVANWFSAGEGRSVFLRPDRKGTTRAVLTLQTEPHGEEELEPEAQKAFLRERFRNAGWETPRVLAGLLSSEDFYLDVLRQVKMARWSRGRVVLCGDAAWCVTPLGGVGSSLAITGAYVLAGELSANANLEKAFGGYERIMRPLVDKGQSVPKFGPRLAQPHSQLGVALQAAALRVAATPAARKLVAKLITPRPEANELPDYSINDCRPPRPA